MWKNVSRPSGAVVTKAFSQFIALGDQPFSAVDDIGFRHVLSGASVRHSQSLYHIVEKLSRRCITSKKKIKKPVAGHFCIQSDYRYLDEQCKSISTFCLTAQFEDFIIQRDMLPYL